MQPSDSLRIRAPVVDIQTPVYAKDLFDSTQDKNIQRIPTYILIISMTNFTIFVYNGDKTHLYFSIITTILWILSLLDAIHDKNMILRPRQIVPQLETEV